MKSKEKDPKIKLNSEKVQQREREIKVVKIGLIIMLLFLIIIYFLLRVVYETGHFTITLDSNFAEKSGLVMYESLQEKEERVILKAEKVEFMDNISYKWLPDNLNNERDGSHNGKNYLAYTFYIENKGSDVINYWYKIDIDDIIKNVDKAIRVMVYLNGEYTVYARPNERTGGTETERDLKNFVSDMQVCLEQTTNFRPGQIDKFTIVVYIEGDDPDCIDDLIGGELKMHMDITEEHFLQVE